MQVAPNFTSKKPERPPDGELNLSPADYSLLTDLYQLTMTACYVGEGLDQKPASFELFVRRLPKGFGYLIAMGLAQVLEYLEQLSFSPSQIQSLQATGIFSHAPAKFWQLLADARFSGDVWAVPEGTAIFANEPILRIEAPLWQAQLVETYLLNTINYQTIIATRAARLRDIAGRDAILLEFGTRRAFSPQASLWAARAGLAGGLDATSNVLAAIKLGEKPSGTMAHSLVMALTAIAGNEMAAFTAFHRYFPGAPLLIDTYDTIAAAEKLAEKIQAGEMELAGVRLDSGDLVSLSQQVRSLLPDIPIFASGDLDEWEIARLKSAGAKIDGYGLGTKLVTGEPVNGVYKLVEIDSIPTMKQSSGKVTYPGRKQIFRRFEDGVMKSDRLGLISETPIDFGLPILDFGLEPDGNNPTSVRSPSEQKSPNPKSQISNPKSIFPSDCDEQAPNPKSQIPNPKSEQPLLQPVFKQGKRVYPLETLAEIRQRTAQQVASLPTETRQLENPTPPPIEISPALLELTEKTIGNG